MYFSHLDTANENDSFKANIQDKLHMFNTKIDGSTFTVQELTHSSEKSHVRVYIVDDFLSKEVCDGLTRAHLKHVHIFKDNTPPLVCFESLWTMQGYLKEAKLDIKVSDNDFTEGTTCVNETFSGKLQEHLVWSFSTAFYRGENQFSSVFEKLLEKLTALSPDNGGKFQITSYPVGVGECFYHSLHYHGYLGYCF